MAKEEDQPEYGHIIQDSLLLASHFRECTFTHVNRLGNSVGHLLTRHSKKGNELQVWMESMLDDITLFVTRDSLDSKNIYIYIYIENLFNN